MQRAPQDWGDLSGWERYWQETLANDFFRDYDSIGFAGGKLLHYIRGWRKGLRLLCAGNGISLEPYALAHLGFQVVVVDISSTACEFVRQAQPTPELLAQFFAEEEETRTYPRKINMEQSLARVARVHIPGGSVLVLQEDIFQHQPEKPYHAISSIRALQGFRPEQQLCLARLFFDWLLPGGRCIVETMNMVAHRHSIEARFLEAGFFREAPGYVEWWNELRQAKEAARSLPDGEQKIAEAQARWEARWAAAREETKRRLANGEKLAIFSHASG
jgi:hypothetical protein